MFALNPSKQYTSWLRMYALICESGILVTPEHLMTTGFHSQQVAQELRSSVCSKTSFVRSTACQYYQSEKQ